MDIIVACPKCREWVVVLAEHIRSPTSCTCGETFDVRRVVHNLPPQKHRWLLNLFGLVLIVVCPLIYLAVQVVDVPLVPWLRVAGNERHGVVLPPQGPIDPLQGQRNEVPPPAPWMAAGPNFDPTTDKDFLARQARERALLPALRKLTPRQNLNQRGTLIAFRGSGPFAFAGSVAWFASTEEGKIHLWDLTTGAKLRTISHAANFVRTVTFSPDAKLLAIGAGKNLLVFRTEDGTLVKELTADEHVQGLAFTSDGRRLTMVAHEFGNFREAKCWDVASWEEKVFIARPQGECWSFSQDGDLLFCRDGLLATMACLTLGDGALHSTALRAWQNLICTGPDRGVIFGARGNDILRLDVMAGTEKLLYTDPTWVNTQMRCSPDGRLLAYVLNPAGRRFDPRFRLIDAATGAEVWNERRDGFGEIGIQFSPGGELIAGGYFGDTTLYAVEDLRSRRWPELAPVIEAVRKQDHRVRLVADKLIVEASRVDPEDWELLVKTMPQINVLSLIGPKQTKIDMSLLKKLPTLEELYLSDELINDENLSDLRDLKPLQILALNANNIHGSGLRQLKDLAALRRLDLTYAGVDDAGLAGVRDLQQLTELDLPFAGITATGVVHLEGLRNLRLVTVPNGLPEESINRLRQALPMARIEHRVR